MSKRTSYLEFTKKKEDFLVITEVEWQLNSKCLGQKVNQLLAFLIAMLPRHTRLLSWKPFSTNKLIIAMQVRRRKKKKKHGNRFGCKWKSLGFDLFVCFDNSHYQSSSILDKSLKEGKHVLNLLLVSALHGLHAK